MPTASGRPSASRHVPADSGVVLARSRIQTEKVQRPTTRAGSGRPRRRRGARRVTPVAKRPSRRARARARAPPRGLEPPPPRRRDEEPRGARHAGVSRAAVVRKARFLSSASAGRRRQALATPTTRQHRDAGAPTSKPTSAGRARARATPMSANGASGRFFGGCVFVFAPGAARRASRGRGARRLFLCLARLFSSRRSRIHRRSASPAPSRRQAAPPLWRARPPTLAGDGGQVLVQAGVRVSGAGASTVSQHLRPRLLKRHAEPLALRRGVRRGDARGAARLLRQALGDAPSGGDALGPAAARARRARARRLSGHARRAEPPARTRRSRRALRLLLGDARGLDRARGVPQLRGDPFSTVASTARRAATASALVAWWPIRRPGRRRRCRMPGNATTRSRPPRWFGRTRGACRPWLTRAARTRRRGRAASTAGTRRRRCAARRRARAREAFDSRPVDRVAFARDESARSRRARRAASPPNRRSPTGPTRGGRPCERRASPRRAPVPCRRRNAAPRETTARLDQTVEVGVRPVSVNTASLGRSRDASRRADLVRAKTKSERAPHVGPRPSWPSGGRRPSRGRLGGSGGFVQPGPVVPGGRATRGEDLQPGRRFHLECVFEHVHGG